MRAKLGEGRCTSVDFRTPRLLCVAGEFLPRDKVAAENSRRRVELLRYRRYGDAYVALEWVHGGEVIDPTRKAAEPPRRTASEEPASVAPQLSSPSAPGAVGDPDYTVNEVWGKASEETRTLFLELNTLMHQLGRVRTVPFKKQISFCSMAAAGKRNSVITWVYLRVRSGIRVQLYERHVPDIPLEDGFTHLVQGGTIREIVIRDREQIRRAEPLLRAAYDLLSRSAS